MTRLDFLRNLSLLGAGTLFAANPGQAFDTMPKAANTLEKIGIQFFSLPKMLEKDFRAAVDMLARYGYREVEMYGPYPFSDPANIERWASLAPALGFQGSGFFGYSVQEVKAIFDEQGMSVPSMHTDLGTLQEHMGPLAEAANQLGARYVVLPAIPEEERTSLDDYKRLAETFNQIGQNAQKEGIAFGYHNHGYGLSEVDGQVPLFLLLDHTDPGLVFLEMDVFWTTAGKADPLELLEKYPGRYKMMHVKDMKEKATFPGDGGDPSEWMALYPKMTTAGNGVIDLETIIPAALKAGVDHFFVEQDTVDHPELALKASIDFLKTL